MSDLIRYNVKCGDEGYHVVESLGGEWVRFGDYARLQYDRVHDMNQIGGLHQENVRFKAQIESYRAAVMVGVTENARLKADVERLTKAGDAFSSAMDSLARFANEDDRLLARKASLAFKAAKEGKPSL
jgi:hypothetical protein